MSHFLLLVTGENLSEQLQPFHEYECTGTDDQYVVDVDETAELREQYATATAARFRAPDGSLHDPYADEFYRDPTAEEAPHVGLGTGCGNGIMWTSKDWGDGRGYRAKVHFTPDGYTEVDVPNKEVLTFAEYVEGETGREVVPHGKQPDLTDTHKYGYILVDENGDVLKVVGRTNPNAKWDWWVEGGRYADLILTKSGALVNQARKGDIDFDTMRNRAAVLAEVDYDSAQRLIAGRTFVPWSQVRKDYEGRLDEGRTFYRAQPVIQDWQANDTRRWAEPEDYLLDRDAFVVLARKKAFSTFAVLHEGKWSERGEMGWFGCVSDDTGNDWYEGYSALIDGLSDETLITFVDCHI